MYKCKKCEEVFPFPEIKRPCAGHVRGEGILGFRKMEPVKFCPECLSTDIEQIGVKKAV